ncbi:cytochrome c oxidase accessory protein CcoG [Massilia agilis]|uniref:Cytochrome c oxidase accessory protein CcoG n=1 Tax=Massilia agilis TaxID=1811226 RepID=A0ABT2D5W7_9BURK|nr:cytochrome c oxidase accessory protein CcoG [Massilia agilis]MCS0806705.1 cytochrome c oxidase accessory protein CcoG [Massilia agilis]
MNAPKEAVIKMYTKGEDIYPREVKGRYATLRWLCVWLTQLVFYGLPWLQWNGRQAVLFDLTARKFYLFGLVLWPQDFIYLAGLLIICAYGLFLVTAVAGRVWCGFACPQTVYTEIFLWIEQKIEGARSARIRLNRQPWNAEKIAKKSAKHAAWGVVALWTGFTFVAYFTPLKALVNELVSWSFGPWETWWIFFYAFATYGNAGFMREQVCKYMCPYARFQSSMFDHDTLVITYDAKRGEPRAPLGKKAANGAAGDCIDCSMCVQVCPAGIDIRNGLQYECIGCAACVDACNSVMDKIEKPRGLIRYATEHALVNGLTNKQAAKRVFRPRVLIYTGLLGLIITAFFGTLALRTPLKMDVIRDRGSMGREVEDDQIENVYRLQIMNTGESSHRFKLKVEGLEGAKVVENDVIEVPGATTRGVAVRVRVPEHAGKHGSNKIEFELTGIDDPSLHVEEKAVFIVPR